MKRAVLVVVSSLALVVLLIADVAWPKASTAHEIPAATPGAVAAATPEAAASAVPKEATVEASGSSSQETTAEEASVQNMPGSVEDALDQLDKPAAGSPSAAEGSGDEQQSKGEAASQHNDMPATDESVAR